MNSQWAPEDRSRGDSTALPTSSNPADVFVWWAKRHGISYDEAVIDQVRVYCNSAMPTPSLDMVMPLTTKSSLRGAPELSPSEQGKTAAYPRHLDYDPDMDHGLEFVPKQGPRPDWNLRAHVPDGARIETISINDDLFARTGERREFGTGAHRDANENKGRFDLLPWDAIEKIARHFQKGAKTHGERNWERGIPLNVLLDSAVRHLGKELDGRADEDHLTAAAWNVLCAIAIRLRCERGALPEELDNT